MWLLIPILIYCIIFYYTRHIHTHWKRRGFPSERTALKPKFLQRLYKREFHLTRGLSDVYKQSRERFFGIYLLFRPILLVRDITLAKDILDNGERCFQVTNWNYMHFIKKVFYFEKIKTALKKDMYRELFESIEKVGDNMLIHLMESWPSQLDTITVDIARTIGTLTNDIIGKLFYGLDVNSFNFPLNIINQQFTNSQHYCPLRQYISSRKFQEVLRAVIKQRELLKTTEKDILQILIQTRNSQYMRPNQEMSWNIEVVTEREKSLTLSATAKLVEELTSVLFESIAKITVLTLHEVLQQPAVLTNVLNEIKDVSKLHELKENHLNFNAIEDMVYTEFCIKETLRKYPPVPLIKRICCKNYRIPSSKYTLNAGYSVLIPVQEIQNDEKYFSEPMLYKPERFLTIKEQKWSSAYIPFGLGAKAEIAETLTLLIVKIMLTKLLLTFDIEAAAAQQRTTNANAASRCTKFNLKRKRISWKL